MKKMYLSPEVQVVPLELGLDLNITIGSTETLPVNGSATPKDAADAYAQEMMAIEEGGEVEDLW